jgi:hypothetical protein
MFVGWGGAASGHGSIKSLETELNTLEGLHK